MKEYTIIDEFRVKEYIVQRQKYIVPLVYSAPHDNDNVEVVAQVIQKSESISLEKAKLVCYLQGGPGGSCATFSGGGYAKFLADKGFTVVLMDQRGTGWLTPIELPKPVEYLLNFRADLIVRDAEVIRQALIGDEKWMILGQSYGGFCSFTYLSLFPNSLKALLITGGIPPIGYDAEHVYTATYARTEERNNHYYRKYPTDDAKVKRICSYLNENKVTLPDGGNLSIPRFQQLGIKFGGSGGTDSVHQIVVKFDHDLNQFGHPTRATLSTIQNAVTFDALVIYALFQENIYSEGTGPHWAAHRLRPALYCYENDTKVKFTGEMVYPFMYEDYAELRPWKKVAQQLMDYDNYGKLYDLEQLKKNKVPVAAAVYVYDQYVDFDTCRLVLGKLDNPNVRPYITSEFFHNGIGANPDRVVGTLLQLLKGEID